MFVRVPFNGYASDRLNISSLHDCGNLLPETNCPGPYQLICDEIFRHTKNHCIEIVHYIAPVGDDGIDIDTLQRLTPGAAIISSHRQFTDCGGYTVLVSRFPQSYVSIVHLI